VGVTFFWEEPRKGKGEKIIRFSRRGGGGEYPQKGKGGDSGTREKKKRGNKGIPLHRPKKPRPPLGREHLESHDSRRKEGGNH